MKNLYITSLIFILSALNVFGQDNISYTVIKDDPNFFIHIKGGVLADFDFKKNNLRSGYFLGASVNLTERFYLGVDFASGIEKWNKAAKDSKSILNKSMLDFSGRGTLFFSVDESRENVKIVLKTDSYTSGNYRYTNEKYMYAPATFIKKFGLTASAGFYRNSMTEKLEIDTLYKWQNNATQGITNIDNSTAYFSGARFSAGIHFSKISDFKINASNKSSGETYGTKSSSSNIDVFVEALFMPLAVVNKDMTTKDTYLPQQYTLSEKPDIMNFGYRVKVETGSSGLLGIGFRVEFGQRPGIKTSHKTDAKLKNLYGAVGMYLSINK